MQARMKNPGFVFPEVIPAVRTLSKAIHSAGVPEATLELVHLRVSQINGCAACNANSLRRAHKAGEIDERLVQLSAWREADCYTDAERAALAMADAATRLADRPGVVSNRIWDEAADHFDEDAMAAIILEIALTNFFNRTNTTFAARAA